MQSYIFKYKANDTFGKLSGNEPTGFEVMISDDGTIKYNELDIHNNTLDSISYRFI